MAPMEIVIFVGIKILKIYIIFTGLPLGFDSCFTAFLVICAGGILAFILLMIEKISKICFDLDISKLYEKDVKKVLCCTCGQYVAHTH